MADEQSRDAKLLAKLKAYLSSEDLLKDYEDAHYMRLWFNHTELVAAKKSEKHGGGKLVWRFPVQKEYLNFMKQYAGGAQAVVHDVCTAWTLLTVSQPGWGSLGMSRTLNMSYLKTASAGDVLLLKCEIVQIGSRMAMIRGVLEKEDSGEIVSTSEHHLNNADKSMAAL